MIDGMFPETCDEALARWDSGEPLQVIEMGGMGPGYEQCIVIVTMELVRRFKDDPAFSSRELWSSMSEDEKKKHQARFDAAVHAIDRRHDLGLSGAQAGAAMNQAYHFLLDGYAKAIAQMKAIDKERLTLAPK